MADRKQPVKAVSRKRGSDKTRRFPHLKPLSVYSHMVFSKATTSCSSDPSWSPDAPSWNLKVEFSNSRASVGRKRRLDDLCPDDAYNNPQKKPRLDGRSSPDLDSFDTFRQVKLVSTQSSSVVLDRIRRVEETLSDQKPLGVGWIDGSDKTDGQSSVLLPVVHASSPGIVNTEDRADAIAFNYDADEIMCLSPIDGAYVSADGLEDFVHSFNEEQFPAEESRAKQGKVEYSLGKDAQTGSDEGYFTKSFFTPDPKETKDKTESQINKSEEFSFVKSYKITVPNLSNDKTPPVSFPIMSTPLDKFRKLVKRAPILSPKLNLEKESWSSPIKVCKPVKEPSAISLSAETEAFPIIPLLNVNEGNGGVAIHKSLACHHQETHTATQVKEEEDVLSVSQQQAASEIQVMFSEEADTEDSFNSTLPLQVQVKSKVVLPNKQRPEAVKEPTHQHPEKAASEGQRNVFRDVPRPVILYREQDWEKEKKAYVDSVTRHIADNVEDGAMTELLHLMNTVANQGGVSDGRKWQHPSDLTRRNYRLRKSSRLLSLDEWQNLNYRNHRRFAKVPQTFKRSPVL
ncbi:hypothetical protein KOW79_002842 [Hemibagrus wyckioides]|uniref:S100P-binding protein n=2 Tax=Hemibagrus wyckioides TaxID=337641 RepID=A0A9D3P499_9TELE|nr:hypothetical protein KOW79_002842 [Hemibagrus wyckioides]